MQASGLRLCIHLCDLFFLLFLFPTASDVSGELRAKRAGSILLSEIGLDPGIDQCSAMDMLHSFREQNKGIISLTSFCGGLPSPEDLHVPLGYKFSWRPKGVLRAAMNEARYLLDNKVEWLLISFLFFKISHRFSCIPEHQNSRRSTPPITLPINSNHTWPRARRSAQQEQLQVSCSLPPSISETVHVHLWNPTLSWV